MPSTHISLHYHIVFCTKGRRRIIAEPWREGTACLYRRHYTGPWRLMVTIPRTTPVVREEVLNDDQGLRSFYSLNPWLFSLTPPAWQKSDRKVS
jgi:hypothetical protein